ncbi:hypothetical protein EJ110_NYTH27163 [Nymphaea thermarum]|nr:hypothetical protein EJ110_NYTH27163 [Nymphaea thermarum]
MSGSVLLLGDFDGRISPSFHGRLIIPFASLPSSLLFPPAAAPRRHRRPFLAPSFARRGEMFCVSEA